MAPQSNRVNAKERETDHSWSFWFREKMLAPLLLAAILGGAAFYRKLDGMESRMDDRFTLMEQKIAARADLQDVQIRTQQEQITRISGGLAAVQTGYISRAELLEAFKRVEQQWTIERLQKEIASRSRKKEAM